MKFVEQPKWSNFALRPKALIELETAQIRPQGGHNVTRHVLSEMPYGDHAGQHAPTLDAACNTLVLSIGHLHS